MKDYKVIRCIGPCCENQGYIDALQARIDALEKEQSAWRKFTDEANRTLEAADKKIAAKQARIEALEGELAAVTTGLNGYEEQSWCECGHEMELVRPGKFQKCGCCEKVEMLQARIEALECALSTRELELKELCQHYDAKQARIEALKELAIMQRRILNSHYCAPDVVKMLRDIHAAILLEGE